MAEEFRVLRPREYHSQLVAKGRRTDGRTLAQSREVKLETEAIKTADSSSLVKLGNTSIVCGCTAQISKFQNDGEIEDEIKIRVEMPPICSNPTGQKVQITEQLLTRTLKNILSDSKCLDRSQFHIEDSDKYWSVDVEIICLNYDGGLIDASLIAVLAALGTLRLNYAGMEHRISLNLRPVCSSFAVINDRVIIDPSLEEETVAYTCFSVTIDPTTGRLCNVNKVGGQAISTRKLTSCIELARSRAKEIDEFIRNKY